MMELIKYLSTSTLVLSAVFLFCCMLRTLRVTPNYYWLAFLVAVSVAVWGYCFTPSPNFDLYRLYKNIDSMRDGTFKEKVFLGTESNYSGLYTFNALCYIVSQLGNNRWLSFISVFVVFSTMLGVLISYFQHEGYSSKGLLLCIAMIFTGMQMPYVFSGVRNTMAVSMSILGLYLFFYLRKHRILAIILYFCACTTHPMVLILLPAVLLCGLRQQRLIRCAALFVVPFIFGLMEFFSSIQLSFFQTIAGRLDEYKNSAYGSDRPEMIANSVLFIMIGFCYWYLKSHRYIEPLSAKHRKFENLYYILGFAMLGSVVHRDFALRQGYIMGALNIPMLCKIYFGEYNDKKLIRQHSYILTFVMMVIIICMLKVFYDSYYTLSRMVFT